MSSLQDSFGDCIEMEFLLEMKHVDKFYGSSQVLFGAQLNIKHNEIHGLIGANGAGKSTLMKILCGEIPFQNGEIIFNGKHITPSAGKQMMDMGIIMIHQEISIVSSLNIAQYVFLGREFMKNGFIDDKKMIIECDKLLNKVDAGFSSERTMSSLSLAEKQLVEIAKALSFQLKLLILDEPTTALGEKECRRFFEIIRELKSNGISVIFISHRLNELLSITDCITVMRDGKYITTLDTQKTKQNELVRLLAGHDIQCSKKRCSSISPDAKTVLEVRNLSTDLLKNISFSLKEGEILGLAGLSGSGRSETVRAICGIDAKAGGDIFLNGNHVIIRSPKEAADLGICYLSEDRNLEGYIPDRSIIANTVLSSLSKYKKGLFLNDKAMEEVAVSINRKLNTKYSNPHAVITSLSGGNVQKVIIAKWLLRNPQIFIFDEPTKGIDVGSKNEIYEIINSIVSEGHSVILISSETKELLDNCDRLVVLFEGTVSGSMAIEETTVEKLMAYAHGRRLENE